MPGVTTPPGQIARQGRRSPFRALGPGLLFAGAAIGVSHLVQSTTAGALYGLSLIVMVVLAHAMKLPAMLFGPRYSAATGTSLLSAYRRQGRHALWTFAAINFGTMFTIQAAITLVTAAIVKFVVLDPLLAPALGTDVPLWAASLGMLALCAALLAAGGYRWLDLAMKILMVILALTTFLAAGLELTRLDPASVTLLPVIPEARADRIALVLFVVALVGWMPAPMDIAVWHSIWTLAKRDQTGCDPTRRECEVDFSVGYALCVLLAICFVVLGAGTMHARGIEPAASGPAFAAQLIDLYTEAIGAWVRPVIASCAVAAMLSTTLTVLDALPRTTVWLLRHLRADTDTHPGTEADPERHERDASTGFAYWAVLVVLSAGAMLIIVIATRRADWFRGLVDLATTLSFLGTPLLAWFNHRAMHDAAVPAAHRPGPGLRRWSLAGVWFWTAFAALFLWVRFIA